MLKISMHNSKPFRKSQFKNAIIKITIFWAMIHAMCKVGTELTPSCPTRP